MTQHSSAELDSEASKADDVPLSDRPLMSDDDNTVVRSGETDSESVVDLVAETNSSAREIRERLFPGPGETGTPERGLVLGHFRVDEQVGAGGMGAVFRAKDLELSRDVALKVLNPVTAADPSLVARFRNEARACAQLNHDNIARVHFTGQQDGVHFIAYEFAAGQTIKQLIQRHGQLSSADVVNYAIQSTLALSHIDAAGVVHRDIKPANIILTDTGRIKVVDLGLARRESNDSVGDLTVAGTTLGTFDYIAPEQARDPRFADIRSDIYSLGCTVYHMLTGRPPYPEGTALQKLLDHQGKSPPDPRAVVSEIPVALSAIVQKMMHTDPDSRYQDPGQLLVDLTAVATQMGLRTVPAEGVVWRRVPIRRVREMSGAIFLSGAVLAICAAALTMHFFPNRSKTIAEEEQLMQSWIGAYPSRPETGTADTASQTVAQPDLAGDKVPPPDSSEMTGNDLPEPVLPPEAMVVKSQPIVVRSAEGISTPQESLAQAWSSAESGDEIILDFDGPFGGPVPCLSRLGAAQNISIRAADGRFPVLEFQGDETSENSGSRTPGQLFYLSNSRVLTLEGVHLKVDVRSEVQSDQWVLFESSGPNRITLKDCSITVVNPGQVNTTVVQVSESRADSASGSETNIRFENVIVRGGCDVVTIASQAGGSVSFSECAFGLNGSVLANLGSSDPSRLPGLLTLSMEQVTTISSQPAIRMVEDSELLDDQNDTQRTLAIMDVNCESSVFAAIDENRVLVQSRGNSDAQELEDFMVWHGSHNIYHGVDIFWQIESGRQVGSPREFTYSEWVELWTRITAAKEMESAESQEDIWEQPEVLKTTLGDELFSLSAEAFSLSRSAFFSKDLQPLYQPNDAGRPPGVDTKSLRTPLQGNESN